MRRGRAVLVVVAGVLLVAVAFGAPDDGRGDPLAPDGTGPTGAAGLVLLLEELGADVDTVRGPPPPDADTAVLLQDRYAEDDVDATIDWVADGGVLLVADPRSALAAGAVDGPCPAALDGVDVLRFDGGTVARGEGTGRCFDGGLRFADVGGGTVAALRTPVPLVNEHLDDDDDAVLAAALLAPRPGTRVAFVEGPSVLDAAGDESLNELVDPRVRQGIVQAALAVLLWVAWRARRLGRPVVEEQPVAVAGSELVVAVGRLLDARRRPDEAAEVLRADARRTIGARMGLGPDADVRTLAAAVAGRAGLDVDRTAAALGERRVTTDADLVAVADDLDRIRTDLLGSRTT